MAWRHHIESTAAKATHTYLRTFSLFKNGLLCADIKLTPYKPLIRSVIMVYASPTWNCASDA
jgi:hypothetical protein